MRLKTSIFAVCLFLLALPLTGACSGKASSSTINNTEVIKPVEIVSVTGPMPPFNPGGPNVEIAVKNTSIYPVTHLIAQLNLNLQTPPIAYVFDFGLTQDAPLAPGATTNLTRNLINGSFNDIFYTITLDVGYTGAAGEATANYAVQIQIGSPPATS
jgi:hypothetical protein